MMIDCGTCQVRGDACADCVVTFLTIPVRAGLSGQGTAAAARTSAPRGAPELDDAEQAAISVLARSGLVPPLRMVRGL